MANIPLMQQVAGGDARPLPSGSLDSQTAFTGSEGQGLEQAGQAVMNVGHAAVQRDERQRAIDAEKRARAKANGDANSVLGASAQLNDFYNASILSQDPKKPGYLATRGKDALDKAQEAREGLKKQVKEIAGGLYNDEQRLHFATRAQALLEQADREIETHFAAENREYAKTTSTNAIRSATDAAVLAARAGNRAGGVAAALKLIPGAVLSYAVQSGAPPEQTQQLLQAAVTDFHQRVTTEFLNTKQIGKAQAYWAANRSAMTNDDRTLALERDLAGATDGQHAEVEAMRVAADAAFKAGEGPVGQLDRLKGYDLIDQRYAASPLKDQIRERFDHRAANADAAWRDTSGQLAAQVGAAGIDPATGKFNKSLVKPSDWAALKNLWPAKATELEKQDSYEKAQQNFAELAERLFVTNWEDTARMPHNEFFGMIANLPATQQKRLSEGYEKIQREVGKPPDEKTIFEESRVALGLGTKTKISQLSVEKKLQLKDLYERVSDAAREETIRQKGVFPAPERIRTITQGELQVVESHVFSPNVHRFEQETRAELDRVKNRFRARGLPVPTDDVARGVLQGERQYRQLGTTEE